MKLLSIRSYAFITLILIASINVKVIAQWPYTSECEACQRNLVDGWSALTQTYRNQLDNITPLFGVNSGSYLGNGAAFQDFAIGSTLWGMMDTQAGLSTAGGVLQNISGVFGALGTANQLLGAANTFYSDLGILRDAFNTGARNLDWAACDCFRRNNCANGCNPY